MRHLIQADSAPDPRSSKFQDTVSAWRERLAPLEDADSRLIAQSQERVLRSRALLARTRRMLGMQPRPGPDQA